MEFNKLVHQPTRLRIFAHLYANGPTGFTALTSTLEVTNGNLASHIDRMAEADCVAVEKEFVDDTPQTTYRLTDRGEELFEDHVRTLESLIADLDTDSGSDPPYDPDAMPDRERDPNGGPGPDPTP
ncbi:transcriptional regulator [Natrinema thermotolerans]|uniref:Transcriptional regulator n=1 Tax=Natrinema thermotolerans TaxID=121872 RepID=A0AAF0PF07_9EURY|nr:transcriptional regulator [Natrinema thermotolerans]ELZ11259.1 transcriptional regulator [Natrinema thermotolerans DSM 11552]QCC58372.1 transcriptional regulator [Natrinema thermotolerans]WMT09491.1 transcriptional regulator [Natrinema thermotolerans]